MTKTRKKRSAASFKDVQIAYLCRGLSVVEEMHRSKQASPNTIRRALSHLKETGSEVASLENFVNAKFGIGARGRAAPIPGQERIYRAQQIKTSGPFLRLPLTSLAVKKGEVIKVAFEDDRIVVKRS